MANEFDPVIINIFDEDGKEYNFELIDEIDHKDGHYVALLPVETDASVLVNEPDELVILKVIEEDGEQIFITIDDDDEADDVADIFIDRLDDLYDIEEDPEA